MIEHIVVIAFMIGLFILSIEFRNLLRAILSFAGGNVALSAILYMLGAPLLAVFQLLIYAGAVTILFLVTIHAGEESEEEKDAASAKIRILSIILAVFLVAVLLMYSPRVMEAVRAPQLGLTSLGEHPEFLWVNRWLDLLIQAFIILAVVASISVQLRKEEREEREVEGE